MSAGALKEMQSETKPSMSEAEIKFRTAQLELSHWVWLRQQVEQRYPVALKAAIVAEQEYELENANGHTDSTLAQLDEPTSGATAPVE